MLSKRCNFLLDVIKIIPTNQLMLCLICHSNKKIRNKNEKKNNLFHPEGCQCPTKFLLNYVTYGKDSFEIVLTPP